MNNNIFEKLYNETFDDISKYFAIAQYISYIIKIYL